MKNILVIGAGGQIGSELVPYLRSIYGRDNVIAADRDKAKLKKLGDGPAVYLDATDGIAYAALVSKYHIDTIYNFVAMLSATGEQYPDRARDLTITALRNSLQIAKEYGCALFTPSSIGVFGPTTPLDRTPQDTIMQPTTIYGICKVTGELLSDYYHHKYGVDTRSVRFPGLISYTTPPGGGTTDYAVAIYHDAKKNNHHTCYLSADTSLDMMYMPDAIRASVELMEADPNRLKHRNSFNITAMQVTPDTLADSIKQHIPDFTINYDIDPVRQAIADSRPNSMDDSCARAERGWQPHYDLDTMTADMLAHV